jgi:glutamate synthase domain-containing protein 1
VTLPAAGRYGVGTIFLPTDHGARARVQQIVERIVHEEAQSVLGWRHVPVEDEHLGGSARASRPSVDHVFIGASAEVRDAPRAGSDGLERKLYVIRKRMEHAVDALLPRIDSGSTSEPVVAHLVYKGMLTAGQIQPTFPDLGDPDMESALGARSTSGSAPNTFPSWPLAHPYRFVAHNGEINTLRGNINWMHARERPAESPLFGDDLRRLLPIIREGGSDTATFDNVLELLVMAGRSLPHAMLMMIPEPWSAHETMDPALKAVLRIPLGADGAVGRPGGDVVHRRRGHRRRARPERPAAVALLRDARRPGGDGVGGRACSTSRPTNPREGAAASRAASSSSTRRRAHRPRRGDQARAGRGASRMRLAARETSSTSTICRRRPYLPRPSAEAVIQRPAHVRLHRRGSAPAAHADGGQRRGADRLDGHRQRDGRALGSARTSSTTISSRRSPR